jgi:hypothetical protein
LSLLWDLDARNHEVTLLKIKHIRLRERYGEGEIPHESKTGTGPVLLTCSFPYVRDWLNEHPFKNEPNARLICNLLTGGPIKADSLCTVMKQLRRRILRLLESGSITIAFLVIKFGSNFLSNPQGKNLYTIKEWLIINNDCKE